MECVELLRRSTRANWYWSTTCTSTPLRSNACDTGLRQPVATPRDASPSTISALLRLAEDAESAPPRGTRGRARPGPPPAAGWICRRRRAPGSKANSERAGCASMRRSPRVQPLEQERALFRRERFDGERLRGRGLAAAAGAFSDARKRSRSAASSAAHEPFGGRARQRRLPLVCRAIAEQLCQRRRSTARHRFRLHHRLRHGVLVEYGLVALDGAGPG